ncbi:MAG: hypothetical protein ACRC62_31760 [Microcoleus sp.]
MVSFWERSPIIDIQSLGRRFKLLIIDRERGRSHYNYQLSTIASSRRSHYNYQLSTIASSRRSHYNYQLSTI